MLGTKQACTVCSRESKPCDKQRKISIFQASYGHHFFEVEIIFCTVTVQGTDLNSAQSGFLCFESLGFHSIMPSMFVYFQVTHKSTYTVFTVAYNTYENYGKIFFKIV